ncbi:hypothetical protein [Sphingomonas sp. CFBP 13706]|uniref:hypothetical protein n=1 Tax=Sphingomonas sp. CFBP 13706 TaxID=2775314 RepID=UPI00177B0F7B|nr:hypothetical protein [Sphingomonas sp. CFBP 13706]MBD8737042.1 hypothetical protein [Sphingomonas sp. CFBP 13706]
MTTTTKTRDELGEQIITAGLAENDFILDLNGGLTVPSGFPLPSPWDLPSRLFRFPIEVCKARGDRPRTIGLRHPDLAGHPFVQHVEAALGFKLDPNGAPNENGYSTCESFGWFHAVDLVTAGQWRALLDTSDFTTTRSIFNAVDFGLRYSDHSEGGKRHGHLSTSEARQIMDELGATEPINRASIIRELGKPSACNSEGKKGGERWPINGKASSLEDQAWAMIFGIEDGWFEYDRAGFLQWSVKGRDRYSAGNAVTYVEAKTGQAAFAF